MINKAILYATEKHKNQKRKDGVTPYIYHPLEIAISLKNKGYGEKYQVTAILHDTVEDTDATEEEIREFGDDVFEAVMLLTKTKDVSEEEYIEKILRNKIARVVKEEDKLKNLAELQTNFNTKFVKHYVSKSQVYRGKFSSLVDEEIDMAEKYLEDLQAEYLIYQAYNGRKAYLKMKDGKTYIWRNSAWEESDFDVYSDEYGENLTYVKYEDIKSALI